MIRGTTEGIIIKSKNFGDADKIFTIYSKKRGKISVSAKGIRKINSRRAGNLDLLNRVSFSFIETFGLPVLAETTVLNSFPGIKKNLEVVKYGYSILEILDRLLPEEEENEEIYNLSIATLENLNRLKEGGRRLSLVYFEYKLLVALGYDPVFNFCTSCLRDLDDAWKVIKFNPPLGGIVCDSCNKSGHYISFEDIFLLTEFKTLSFKNVQQLVISAKTLSSVEELIREYLEYILEKPLKSFYAFSSRSLTQI